MVKLEARDDTTEMLGVLETAGLLRELTAGLISTDDFEEALARLVRTVRDAVTGIAGCGITVLRDGSPAGTAAAEPRLAELDGLDHGPDFPAMSAIRRQEMVLAVDLLVEERWPTWTARARALGVRAVLATPVDIDDHVLAAITLYADERVALTARRQLTAMLLAEHAGLLLAAVRNRARQAAIAGELDRTVTAGEAIGQAIGVIMSQRGCPAPEALQVLHSAANALAIPLPEVAERLLASIPRGQSD